MHSRIRILLPAALALLAAPLAAQQAPDFTAVDRYADAAPPAAEVSVATLGAYLAHAGPDELTRARALYRWIAGHVGYDADGFRTHDYGDLSPEGVLRRRTAVCEGYARLSEALGAAMGLRVVVVSGWSKGYGYRAGQTFDGPTNHAWNAVQIDGRWQLMDPTWGAGFLDERLQFVRHFQDHYFLTPPAAFVFDHLPQDPQWQLLPQPVSSQRYTELAYLRPAFFAHGLKIGNRGSASFTTGDTTTVTFGVTEPVELIAELVDPATSRPVEGTWAMAQVNGRRAELHAAFPRAGDYLLRLFARPRGATDPAQWAVDYRVNATAGRATGFPLTYQALGATGAVLFEPLEGTLDASHAYHFRLTAPGALDVAVVQGTRWTHLVRSGDEYVADVSLVAGPLTVFAKYEASGQYRGLLRYVAR